LSSVVLVILNSRLYLLTILVTVPFFILSSVVIIKKIPLYRRKAQESYADYTNWIVPIIESSDAINVFEGEEIVLKKIEEASKTIMKENVKAHTLTAWSFFFNIISGNLGYFLLLLTGNSMMGTGVKDFAELMKITQYRGETMKGILCVNAGLNGMKGNASSAARLEEIFSSNEEE
ncbi:MAG: ABC transporter ATP-binding protein, partial [Lachnospiraceae bacterium]|nr:ABC transporter ATP-binding protein [Lachnospiraceae bacterium]